jgi:hypothetical protein
MPRLALTVAAISFALAFSPAVTARRAASRSNRLWMNVLVASGFGPSTRKAAISSAMPLMWLVMVSNTLCCVPTASAIACQLSALFHEKNRAMSRWLASIGRPDRAAVTAPCGPSMMSDVTLSSSCANRASFIGLPVSQSSMSARSTLSRTSCRNRSAPSARALAASIAGFGSRHVSRSPSAPPAARN